MCLCRFQPMHFMMMLTWLFGMMLLAPSATMDTSYLGQNFTFGIVPLFREYFRVNTSVALDIGSRENGSLSVTIPFLGIHNKVISLDKNGYLRIHIDNAIVYMNSGSFQGPRAILISSNTNISVLVTVSISPGGETMTSYPVYPIESLGRHYVAISFKPFYRSVGVIMVVGVSNNTRVTIYSQDHLTNVVLNAFEVYQFEAPYTTDLTGMKISANKEVVVIAGTEHSELGEPIFSQLIPVSKWSDTFVIASPDTTYSVIARALSNDSDFSGTVTNSTTTSLLKRQGKNFYLGPEPAVIVTDGAVEVAQYVDEIMVPVPGVDQYLSEYSFVIPDAKIQDKYNPDKFLKHTLTAIVPTEHLQGLVLDGFLFKGKQRNVSSSIGDWTIVTNEVQAGFHHMTHANSSVKFGLLVYGTESTNAYFYKYGFYVGMAFKEYGWSSWSEWSTCSSTCGDVTRARARTCANRTAVHCPGDSVQSPPLTSALRNACPAREWTSQGCVMLYRPVLRVRYVSSNEPQSLELLCFHPDVSTKINVQRTDQEKSPRVQCVYNVVQAITAITVDVEASLCGIQEYKWGEMSQFHLGCFSNSCGVVRRSSMDTSRNDIRSTPVRHACCDGDFCNRNVTVLSTANVGTAGIIG